MGRIRITGMNSGLDTDSMVRELVNAYEKQGEKYTKAKTKTEWKQEAWTTLNNKIKSFFSKQASNMRFSSAYSKKTTTVSDTTKATVVTSNNAVNGSQTLKINKLAKSAYLTGKQLTKTGGKVTEDTTLEELGYTFDDTTLKVGKGTYDSATKKYSEGYLTPDLTISKTMKLKDFTNQLSEAGYNANFDESTGRLFISSKESGAKNDFTIEADSSDANSAKALTALGLNVTNTDAGAYMTHGDDAEIELNGAKFTSANNTFSINGLTITAKEVTSGNISLVTDTDYNEIYDTIKDFFKEYSSLMNEMDKLYNAASSKGYEPLTSEEKDAMTDDEIEKWEKKIKDSLLKGDSELDTVASAMRRAMLSTFEIGGKTMSLSSFGIHTLGYFESADNEKNAYHIDGNKDDPETAGNEDRLRAMIASDPEGTATFFQKLATELYNAMNKIQSNSDSYTSYGNFFSDKKLQNEYVEQEKQVTKWEDYVAKQEDKYYKQFTAMESAMSSLNSQQQYISQLFAG